MSYIKANNLSLIIGAIVGASSGLISSLITGVGTSLYFGAKSILRYENSSPFLKTLLRNSSYTGLSVGVISSLCTYFLVKRIYKKERIDKLIFDAFSLLEQDSVEVLKEFELKEYIEDHSTYLYNLCKHNSKANLEYVLSQKLIDINCKNSLGETALFSLLEHTDTIKFSGQNIELNQTVNQNLIYGNLQLTFEKKESKPANNTECIKILIENGIDLNCQNSLGDTALIKAAKNGAIENAKLLIQHGADIHIRNNENKTFADYNAELSEFVHQKITIELIKETDAGTYVFPFPTTCDGHITLFNFVSEYTI